jgi:hypothetical protein
MAAKRSKGESSTSGWRPLAQKLTGLLSRRASSRSKMPSPPAASEEAADLSRPGQPEQNQVQVQDGEGIAPLKQFQPLDVESGALESLRLPSRWLDIDAKTFSPNLEQQQQKAAQLSSVTPIADLFAIRLVPSEYETVAEKPTPSPSPSPAPQQQQQPPQPQPQPQESRQSKEPKPEKAAPVATFPRPVSMLDMGLMAEPKSTSAPVRRHSQGAGSVLDRGRPIEPRNPDANDVPRPSRSTRQSYPPEGMTLSQVSLAPPPSRSATTSMPPPPRPVTDSYSDLEERVISGMLPLERTSSSTSKRHSIHETAAAPSASAAKPSVVPGKLRSTSASPMERIRAWQKPSNTSDPKPTSVPQQPPLTRRMSNRSNVASNRLAWVRELEEKQANGGVNRPTVTKGPGSVSNILSMFENKNASSRLPPLTRTNSTSRFSAVGYESVYSAADSATPRTSIDTVRTNPRASSVMSNYDDSFREKLESLVGVEKDKESVSPPERQRVSAYFTTVDAASVKPMLAPEVAPLQVSKPASVEPVAEPAAEPKVETAKTEEPVLETEQPKESVVEVEAEAKAEPETVAETVAETEKPAIEPVPEQAEAKAEAEIEETVAEPIAEPIAEPVAEVEQPAVEPVAEVEESVVEPVAEVEQPAVEPVANVEEPVVAPAAEIDQPAVESAVEPITEAKEPTVEPAAKAEELVIEPVAVVEEPVIEPAANVEELVTEPIAVVEESVVEPVSKAEELVIEPVAMAEQSAVEPIPEIEESVVQPVAEMETKTEEEPKAAPVVEEIEALPEVKAVEQPIVEEAAPEVPEVPEVMAVEQPITETKEPEFQIETPEIEAKTEPEAPATEQTTEPESPTVDSTPVEPAEHEAVPGKSGKSKKKRKGKNHA